MRKKYVTSGRTDKHWRGLCSQKSMTGMTPDTGDELLGLDWEFLLKATTLYATGHVNRWFWRGSLGGVLPDGFDPVLLRWPIDTFSPILSPQTEPPHGQESAPALPQEMGPLPWPKILRRKLENLKKFAVRMYLSTTT
jgi:hypothetical protein